MKKLKGVDGMLDQAWARLVKIRANMKCEVCGKTTNLNSHHIFTRKNRSVRWDVKNGVCLCVGCHVFGTKFSAHGTPVLFTDWLRKKKGKNEIDILTIKANSISKLHKFEKEILLKELNKEINERTKTD